VAKNVQIRNLDDRTYQTLRQRAADAGLSLSQYLRRELTHLATTPTMADVLARADRRRAGGGGVSRDDILAALDADRADRR
jgi:antitoxin FitA